MFFPYFLYFSYMNKKGLILIGITVLLAVLLNLYNKGYFS